MSTTWTCAACRTTNAADACVVCGLDAARSAAMTAAATPPPAAAAPTANAPRGASPFAPPSAGTRAPVGPGPVPAATVTSTPPTSAERSPARRKLIAGAAAAAVVILAAVAGLVVASTRGGSDGETASVRPLAASTTTTEAATTTASTAPDVVQTSATPTTQAAAPPVTAPRTTTTYPSYEDATDWGLEDEEPPTTEASTPTPSVGPYPTNLVVDDPAHLLQIRLPYQMTEQTGGSDFRIWSYGAVQFELWTTTYVDLDYANSEFSDLLGEVTSDVFSTRGQSSDVDGSGIVTGRSSDGAVLYSRLKLRCGDLVRYTLRVEAGANAEETAIGGQIPNDLYSRTAEGDAMGGVHATC